MMITDFVVTHELGFVDEKSRVHVSLTRARDVQITLGNTMMLQNRKNKPTNHVAAPFELAKKHRQCRQIGEACPDFNHKYVEARVKMTKDNVDALNERDGFYAQDEPTSQDTADNEGEHQVLTPWVAVNSSNDTAGDERQGQEADPWGVSSATRDTAENEGEGQEVNPWGAANTSQDDSAAVLGSTFTDTHGQEAASNETLGEPCVTQSVSEDPVNDTALSVHGTDTKPWLDLGDDSDSDDEVAEAANSTIDLISAAKVFMEMTGHKRQSAESLAGCTYPDFEDEGDFSTAESKVIRGEKRRDYYTQNKVKSIIAKDFHKFLKQ